MLKIIFSYLIQKNVYKYIDKCTALISSSNYEDPGFAIIESCFLRKSDFFFNNGPLEMSNTADMCYFYKKNDEEDFINQLILSENNNLNKFKILKAMKFSKKSLLCFHITEN